MKRTIIGLCLLLCFSAFAQTEPEEIQRLKKLYLEVTDLKKKTGIYNDLAWEYTYVNYDSSKHYVNLALKAADKLKDPYWQAVSMEMLAILKEVSGENEEAIKLYFQVIPIRESIGGKGLENTYNNMAIIFRTQNDFAKAYDYFRQSYLIEVKNGNKLGIAGSLINMAITEKYLNNKDSLKVHLWEAMSISRSIHDRDIESSAMINLANEYRHEITRDSALYYYEKALDIAKEDFDMSSIAIIKIGLAEVYTVSGEFKQAIANLNEAENIATGLHSIELLKRIFEDKANVYEKVKDFKKAYEFKNKYIVMNDSLTNLEIRSQTVNLEKKYESEKKERQITELELASAEQELVAKTAKDQRTMLIFLAILLALGVWFGFYRYRKQQRTSSILQDKNKTIAAALHDREILLKEIHHRVKNNLQVVSSLLSIQGREISDEKALEAVNESKHRVQSMALIHQYLYGENDLKSIDMLKYVNQLSNNLFNAYKLDHDLVELRVEVEPIMLDVDTAIPLGIIINELITNALKYAFPDNAEGILTIRLAEENKSLNLFVSDNGVGKSKMNDSQLSFGMKLINAFKNKLKAELEMNTENGYSVSFSIGNYKKI